MHLPAVSQVHDFNTRWQPAGDEMISNEGEDRKVDRVHRIKIGKWENPLTVKKWACPLVLNILLFRRSVILSEKTIFKVCCTTSKLILKHSLYFYCKITHYLRCKLQVTQQVMHFNYLAINRLMLSCDSRSIISK